MSTAIADKTWVTTRAARERLGITSDQVRKLIRQGSLTSRQLPGLRPLVAADDVDRLARESVRPATTGSGA